MRDATLLLVTLAAVAALASPPALAQAPPPNPVDPGIADGSAQRGARPARAAGRPLDVANYGYEVSGLLLPGAKRLDGSSGAQRRAHEASRPAALALAVEVARRAGDC